MKLSRAWENGQSLLTGKKEKYLPQRVPSSGEETSKAIVL